MLATILCPRSRKRDLNALIADILNNLVVVHLMLQIFRIAWCETSQYVLQMPGLCS
jgi:hypothetical protein